MMELQEEMSTPDVVLLLGRCLLDLFGLSGLLDRLNLFNLFFVRHGPKITGRSRRRAGLGPPHEAPGARR